MCMGGNGCKVQEGHSIECLSLPIRIKVDFGGYEHVYKVIYKVSVAILKSKHLNHHKLVSHFFVYSPNQLLS